MTREEEIKKASGELFNSAPCSKTYKMGFEAGAMWADNNPKSPWISVEDDLPCNHKELIECDISTTLVFVKTKYFVDTDYMRLYMDFTWRWERHRGITHWMPIPEPPKL